MLADPLPAHSNGIAPWNDPSLTSDGRISLITDIFSDRNETEAVLHLREDDARLFVEVIDEVFTTFSLSGPTDLNLTSQPAE